MSGIYIRDMKMPTSCADCKLRMVTGCCGNLPHNTRMPNCPLGSVPKHGRLIDADKLKADNPIHMGADVPYVTEVTVEEIIDAAPTIIPASEEGE